MLKKRKSIVIAIGLLLGIWFGYSYYVEHIGEVAYALRLSRINSRENQELESSNRSALAKVRDTREIYLNGIYIDTGYIWDEKAYVPVQKLAESLNYSVQWLPEKEVMRIVQGQKIYDFPFENIFGKPFILLETFQQSLKLEKVSLASERIEIATANQVSSHDISEYLRLKAYINGILFTDKALEKDGQKLLSIRLTAQTLGGIFRYDGEKGLTYLNGKAVKTIFIDGEGYASVDELARVIDMEGLEIDFRPNDSEEKAITPVYFQGSSGKAVALTFDDYLGPDVYKILDLLDRYDVQATFFLIGNNLAQNQQILRELVRRGHEVGNHTWDHLNLHTLEDDEVRVQLAATQLALQKYGGKAANYYRPPGGYYNERINRIAGELGLIPVLWSVNSADADLLNGPSQIKRIVTRRVYPGAIVVMHTNRASSLEALPGIIEELKMRGYQLVTLSKLIQ